ncbi:PREDICTED: probable palmitoyltransferase ZDHHC20 [Nicrophorus vespilloides]|uniref:Palmitoyltransferase n=1 Tax=Nicrophorus vespilloides TaxID=110193 RepID=A0ABM1MP48_NICVS|nr:PREDICTED: probable palmitoyltransferase ZDHHC20 [Nicrophorus vespilloides]
MCSCDYDCENDCCQETLNVFPVVLLILTIIWTYYVYVYEMCVRLIESTTKCAIYLTLFHLLFIPFLIMYFIAMFHRQWLVPEEYQFTSSFYNRLMSARSTTEEYNILYNFVQDNNFLIYTRSKNGSFRYCTECKLLKPDRTHHCSTCDACVIKMDHHCPWINNCVGFTNYKYFIILVMYAMIFCFFYASTTFEYCLHFCLNFETSKLRQLNIVLAFFATLALAVALLALFIYHLRMIFNNETTVESIHDPHFEPVPGVSRTTYDKGCVENFEEQCGWNCCYWFLPVLTADGNGVEFDIVRYNLRRT